MGGTDGSEGASEDIGVNAGNAVVPPHPLPMLLQQKACFSSDHMLCHSSKPSSQSKGSVVLENDSKYNKNGTNVRRRQQPAAGIHKTAYLLLGCSGRIKLKSPPFPTYLKFVSC